MTWKGENEQILIQILFILFQSHLKCYKNFTAILSRHTILYKIYFQLQEIRARQKSGQIPSGHSGLVIAYMTIECLHKIYVNKGAQIHLISQNWCQNTSNISAALLHCWNYSLCSSDPAAAQYSLPAHTSTHWEIEVQNQTKRLQMI